MKGKLRFGEFRDAMLHETTTVWVFTLKTQKQKIKLTVFLCVFDNNFLMLRFLQSTLSPVCSLSY